jgi:MFS transporter, DHA2 family, multidrug resistance protein
MTTREAPFLNPVVFKDLNFLAGTIFIFMIGVVMFATLALLPSMLQGLMNYPVMLAGWITAPRGIGSLIAMFTVGRIIRFVDGRIILAAGFVITAYSLWDMTGFYLQMDVWSVCLSSEIPCHPRSSSIPALLSEQASPTHAPAP